ncbi:MAG: sugar ABC transporter permease [Pseudonocardiales bacterium]|nr:sugar ABC transporter permease [Pseudonocardiales bacterium]
MSVVPDKRESPRPDLLALRPPTTGPAPIGRLVRTHRRRGVATQLRAGELAALPGITSLLSTWVIFQLLDHHHRFLTAVNLSNMVMQIAAVGIIAVGITLVLLLGEIDLSIGSVSGLAAATLAILVIRHGVPEVGAIGLVVLLGLGVGIVQGMIHAAIGVPSFVVTLAGLIGWQGLHLYLLGPQSTINVSDHGIIAILTHAYLPAVAGWSLGAVMVGSYLAAVVVDVRRRRAAGLPGLARWRRAVRLVLLSAGVGLTVGVLNSWRGIPVALAMVVAFAVGADVMLRRTRFGRSIIAIGGNVEAARRAGIPVNRIRITVFALGSAMAAIGGILAVSREFAANQSTGGSDVLLFAIAAAVIGGVSLFGGRGSTYGALLGIAVIGSINNGMYLLELDSSVRFMITAAVLLMAVIIDSLSRRDHQLPAGTSHRL